MTYSIEGNNRGTYDVLQYDGNDYLFIAECINEDIAASLIRGLTN